MHNDKLDHYLYKWFGYTDFRQGQKTIIEDVLKGDNVLGILPTGTGKSICYQLPARLLPGITIVVSPLISLMIDQVKQLKSKGYKSVTALNSFLDLRDRQKRLMNLQKFKLIYLSPEMLQNDWVKKQLMQTDVSLFVIDEAHCISQWGHEFRTDYLKLHKIIKKIGQPPVLALSATATPQVQDDIIEKLRLPKVKKRIYDMDKPNISFSVEYLSNPEEKLERIQSILSSNHTPAMIYFSSRQWTEKAAIYLQEKVKRKVAFYHGGMEQMDRVLVQQQFMNDQIDVICCTNAFGMGVDKGNIRLVIHFHFPTQLESFIQEIGRAGRDGEPCVSLVLYSGNDHLLPQRLIESELPEMDQLSSLLKQIANHHNEADEPIKDEGWMSILELSESQWNFIKYHLEEFGVLTGAQVADNAVIEEVYEKLLERLKMRWKYKQDKLTEMIHWIHEKKCRREGLYKPFQKGFSEPLGACCDHCGFSLNELSFPDNKTEIGDRFPSWQERLALLFERDPDHQ